MTYESIGECSDVIEVRDDFGDGEALHMMDYKSNGATPTIATERTTLYVVFRTCYRISQKLKTGNGFRAIVQNDSTYCLLILANFFDIYYRSLKVI